MKKRILCLVLVLCAAMVMTACKQKEVYPTEPAAASQSQQQGTVEQQDPQQIFSEGEKNDDVDWDSIDYNPASEEDEDYEELIDNSASAGDVITPIPAVKGQYAGATPVIIDPVDAPTATPLPPLSFTYETYTAEKLRLSFKGPSYWIPDDSSADTYTLTNPDTSMDYEAQLSIHLEPVDKNLSKDELKKELINRLTKLGGEGFSKFERSNTAGRKFMNADGVYANYTATIQKDRQTIKVAGRMIIACVNKTLYILHVTYPRGYAKPYIEDESSVYNTFRHSVKTISN